MGFKTSRNIKFEIMAKKSFAVVAGKFAGRMVWKIVYGLAMALIRALVLGYPVKWVWNDLSGLISLPAVDYWQAFKIVLLIGFLCLEWFKEKEEKPEDKIFND